MEMNVYKYEPYGEEYLVKYILQNTDIFDEEIGAKFNTAIKPTRRRLIRVKYTNLQ